MTTREELAALYANDWQVADGVFDISFTPRGGTPVNGIKATQGDLTRSEIQRMGVEYSVSNYDTVFVTYASTYTGGARPLENDIVTDGSTSYMVKRVVETMAQTQLVLFLLQVR